MRRVKLAWLFVLLALFLSASASVRAEPTGTPAPLAVSDSSVIRVASGTLTVLNDGCMVTENGGQLEIVPDRPSPDNVPPPEVSVTTQVVAMEAGTIQQPGPSSSRPTVVRILSGTLVVSNDGSMVTEDGGRIEIVPDTPSLLPSEKERGTEEVHVETAVAPVKGEAPGSQSLLDVTCYEHTAWVSFGSTNYTRITNYCVNAQGNEVVKTIKITNTGSQDTAILDREALGVCGVLLYEWVQSGPWIIGPGATLQFEPWKELHSGWDKDGKVVEEWRPVSVSNCLPDSP